MNRASFQLVDSRGLTGQLSALSDPHHRKRTSDGVYVGLDVRQGIRFEHIPANSAGDTVPALVRTGSSGLVIPQQRVSSA
jgi:hypothetical protein